MFVSEEKILAHYEIDPMLMVGYEGLFGLIIMSIVLALAYFIPCESATFCPTGHLDNFPLAIS